MYATKRHTEQTPVEHTEDVDLRTIEWLKRDLEQRREKKAESRELELVSS